MPDRISPIKILIMLLPWLISFISLVYLVSNFHTIRNKVPNYAFNIFLSLIMWNIICIIHSPSNQVFPITTIYGNPYASLALLIPTILVFGISKINLSTVNIFMIRAISIGTPVAILFIALSLGEDFSIFLSLPLGLAFMAIFMIGNITYQSYITRITVIIASITLFVYLGIVGGSRATLVRFLLLFLSSIAVYFYSKYRFQWFRKIAICSLLLPFFLVTFSVYTGQSFFQTSADSLKSTLQTSNVENPLTKGDTRTFLYLEVYDDLQATDDLLFGRGGGGTYYCPYCVLTGVDTDQRLTVEVGILALLLKGGIIAVLLNLALFYIAIYLALFKANNQYVMGVGYMVLVHTLILFVENLVSYSIYNLSVWFFVGVCLSKELRKMSNQEVQRLLIYKAKKSRRTLLEAPG